MTATLIIIGIAAVMYGLMAMVNVIVKEATHGGTHKR